VRAPIFLFKVIRRELINAIRKKRTEMLANLESIYLHQDNAPAHTASATSLKLDVLRFNRIANPPYSPDLAPMDVSVFPAIKSELRGIRFEDLVELRSRVMSIIATFKLTGIEMYSPSGLRGMRNMYVVKEDTLKRSRS